MNSLPLGARSHRLHVTPARDPPRWQSFAFDSQVQAVLFFHFTPCALDLRSAPMWRTCGGSGLNRWSARNFLSNLGFSVGITPTPAVFQNLWLGLHLQWIPYVTIGGGMQFSAFRSLPADLAVGDAFTGSQADLDNRIARDVGVSPFFFLSINGQEVFTRARDFNF